MLRTGKGGTQHQRTSKPEWYLREVSTHPEGASDGGKMAEQKVRNPTFKVLSGGVQSVLTLIMAHL